MAVPDIAALRRQRRLRIAVAAAGALVVGAIAYASDTLNRSGTVDINQFRVSFLLSGNAGGGTLRVAGKDYPFTIAGLGVGGIGVTKLEAVGVVYNMADLSKFPGVYSQLRTGHALGDSGKGKLWLKNGDGVVIKLEGATKGIGLTLGADAVTINYK